MPEPIFRQLQEVKVFEFEDYFSRCLAFAADPEDWLRQPTSGPRNRYSAFFQILQIFFSFCRTENYVLA